MAFNIKEEVIMPNWCSIDARVIGDKEVVNDFYNLLKKIESGEIRPKTYPDADNNWLGTIVESFGENVDDYPCRGTFSVEGSEIIKMDNDDYYFCLFIDYAWDVPNELFDLISDHYDNDLGIVYYASEPGCGIYETNDDYGIFFDYQWSVFYNTEKSGCESDELKSDEDVIALVEDITGKKCNNIDDALRAANEYNENVDNDDYYININKIVHL